jgi:hypothetical protein
MKRHLFSFLLGLVTLPVFAQAPAPSVGKLHLIPYPKQVSRGASWFRLTAATRIVVNAAHAKEDRLAAESIAEEIRSATGRKVPIVTAVRTMPAQTQVIYLARADDDRALQSRLRPQDLAMDVNFNPQGYVLLAEPGRVIISARSGQGLFYGAQTLRQLVVPLGPGVGTSAKTFAIPSVTIKDWPTMAWRGVHDDISRGPVPTLDYMKKAIRTLAEYKINLYALYIEHVFDYQQNPLIGPREGALSADEIKDLVAYARRYYITILPEQQAFGHLHHVLKYELYSDLAETPHGHVLTPTNPKTYDFIKSLYSEMVPLFPGSFFHIGSDETFELGQGKTKELAQQVGLGRVYLEHLQKVAQIMAPYHKRLMFWGDIAMKYPDLLKILPKDMIAVAWVYDPLPQFDRYIKPFRDAGLDVFVAPGANNWNLIWPNFDWAYVNARNFVRDGQKRGAIGMLNTTWDDDGEALFGMTWPALVFGAAASWQQGESSIDQFADAYDWAFYRNAQDHSFHDVIHQLTSIHDLLRKQAGVAATDDTFWLDPFSQVGAQFNARALPVAHELRISAEQSIESLYRSEDKAHLHADTLDYMKLAAWRLDTLGMKIQFSTEIANAYADALQSTSDRRRMMGNLREITGTNARLQDLRDATNRVADMYRDLWLRENRPYWLDNVIVRYKVLDDEYQQKINDMRLAMGAVRAGGTLPTAAQVGFYVAPPSTATATQPAQNQSQPTLPQPPPQSQATSPSNATSGTAQPAQAPPK